ncbi:MAG: N-formylglutamate amidohydrolase [Planctomycetota bacterium]
MQLFRFQKGYSPILISNPHGGSVVLPEIAELMNESALDTTNADKYLARIFDLPTLESAAMITANMSKVVVDLLADPGSQAMVPVTTQTGEPIYSIGNEPDDSEIAKRREHYFDPYFDQLQSELQRLCGRFPTVVLIDVHALPMDTSNGEPGQPVQSIAEIRFPESLQANYRELVDHLHQQFDFENSGVVVNPTNDPNRIVRHAADHFTGGASVLPFELYLNPCNYLDPDDGSLDYEGRKRVSSMIEPILFSMLRWAEAKSVNAV